MEPRVKRRRLVRDEHGHTNHLTETVLDHEYHAQPSNVFEGCGVQNNGRMQVLRDLIINISKDSNADTKAEETERKVEEIKRIIKKRQALLESLRFKQMDAREWSIKKAHEKTCHWLLKTSEYVNWAKENASHNKHNFLWIKGKPGAGKSTLMKFLLGQLRNQAKRATNEEVILSFFFNARGDYLEKSTAGLYRSLLVQLLETRDDMLYVLDSIQIGHRWTIESLQNLFEKAVLELKIISLTCLIDALDECEEAQIRDMVSVLSDITVIQNRVRICFASRHYPHISVQTGLDIVLETQPDHGKDIASYIASRLIIRDQALAIPIHELLLTKASGVFMWVVLVVSILNKEYDAGNEHILHERIQQFPDSLQDLFHGILTRDANNRTGLLLCIQWVLFAMRPLTPKEMYFAIISGGEAHNLARCHSANITEAAMKRYILNTSKGLTEPTVSTHPTIQFIHESVRDFLLNENGLIRIWPSLAGNVVGRSHDMLKQCCLTYISMDKVAGTQDPLSQLIFDTFPFLSYAYRVLDHADQAQQHGVNQQDFLATFPRFKWVKLHNLLGDNDGKLPYTSEVSLLYILAEANKPSLIRAHPNRQSIFEIESEYYGVPLFAAYASKCIATTQTLMDLEAEQLSESPFSDHYHLMQDRQVVPTIRPPMFQSKHGLLQYIMEYGTEKMLLLYLAKEPYYDINEKDQKQRTILNSAVARGYYMLARALLQHGADMSAADHFGRTPLHISSQHDIDITTILLDHGANISAADHFGRTPLHISSYQLNIGITTILLDRGAKVSATDRSGRTPLDIALVHWNYIMLYSHWHSIMKTARLAQLLIDHGANVSAAADEGQTIIHQFKVDRYILQPLLRGTRVGLRNT